MPSRTDLNDELEALERELGPTLRSALRGDGVRPEFAVSLRAQLRALPLETATLRKSRLRLMPGRAWAALAALLVVGLASATALVDLRPQPADAAVLSELQEEAVTMMSTAGGPCGRNPTEGGLDLAIARGSGGEPVSGKPGPVTVSGGPGVSPTELSDKLAQALGISGDRVRQAMVDTFRSTMPTTLPPDPIDGIANQLGLPRDQVCAAFFDGPSRIGGLTIHRVAPDSGTAGAGGGALSIGGQVGIDGPDGKPTIDLTTATPEQLAGPAQRLGVTPDRLAAALHAVAAKPMPKPPAPPSEDEIINRFAQNLGMSPDKVRAAITQVEGTHGFYFAVPIPDLGKH